MRSSLILARFNWVNKILVSFGNDRLAKFMLFNNRCFIDENNNDSHRIGTVNHKSSYIGMLIKDLKLVELITTEEYDNFLKYNKEITKYGTNNNNNNNEQMENKMEKLDKMFDRLKEKNVYSRKVEDYDAKIRTLEIVKSMKRNVENPNRKEILKETLKKMENNRLEKENVKKETKIKRKTITKKAEMQREQQKNEWLINNNNNNNNEEEKKKENEFAKIIIINPKVTEKLKVQINNTNNKLIK